MNTLRRWLSNGRNKPDGPYGQFAQEADAARNGDFDLDLLARDFVAASMLLFAGDDREFERIRGRIARDQQPMLLYLAHVIVVAAAVHSKAGTDGKLTIKGLEDVIEGWFAVEAELNEHIDQRNAT